MELVGPGKPGSQAPCRTRQRKHLLDQMNKITPPEKLTKKQQIWEYMRRYPDETNYSAIAKGAKVTRHTAAKHFEMIQKMLKIGG